MITPPRVLVIVLAALFSAYHLVLALYTLTLPQSMAPVIVAMVLYALVTVLVLWPSSPIAMPMWMAGLTVAVSLVMLVLVLSQLDSTAQNGFATWPIAAVGTLMTITSVRRQSVFAWVGIIGMAIAVVLWADALSLITIGVVGAAAWVGIAHALSRALVQAARDANLFTRAEFDAATWHATQEAQLTEGRHRLDYMNRVAGPMLHYIIDRNGRLGDEDQRECLHLEGAIRDEIRGRRLMNEDVRIEVMAARRRGVDVTLLDDGGLDDLTAANRDRIQSQVATEISRSQADRIIVRTGVDTSTAAVTVVGLKVTDDGSAAALGSETTDDEVEQWVEIEK